MNDSYFTFLEQNLQQEEPALEEPKNDDIINLTVRADAECEVLCDGDFLFLVNANLVVKGVAPSGEHLLQFVSVEYPDIVLEKIVKWPESGKNYLVIVNELKDLVLAETDRIAAEEAKAKAEEEARLKAEAERKAIEEERKRKEAEEDARRKAVEEEARIERGEDVSEYEVDGFTYTGHIKRGQPDRNGTAVWPDGVVYDGEWMEGKANGHGRMLYANGDIYEGQWKDGKKSGSGKMTWANGDSYEGNWNDDDIRGAGSFTDNPGAIYLGEWTRDNDGGEFDIHGRRYAFKMPYVTKNGGKGFYSGQFKDGIPEGIGRLIQNTGSIYDGDFKCGWRHGHGVMTWPCGDRYEGEFDDDRMNGHGIYTWANGDRYEGGFKDDKRRGYGVMTCLKDHEGIKGVYSVRYEGEWEDNKKAGHGVETWRDLGVPPLFGSFHYEGEFKDGLFHGHGIQTYDNGVRYEGDFVKGKKHGHGVMTDPNGYSHDCVRYEGNWEEDVKCGQGIAEYRNGDVYEGAFKDDEICGKGVYRYQNGDVYEGEGICYLLDFKKHGFGKMTWSKGDFYMYEGGWDHDRFKGSGRLVDRVGKMWDGDWYYDGYPTSFELNGDKYTFKPYFTGRWGGKGLYSGPLNKDGKPEGKGEVSFEDGSSYKGDFHNGLRHGKGILRMSDRSLFFAGVREYDGVFKEDIPTGHGVLFRKDGVVIEGEFEDGVVAENTQVTCTFTDGLVRLCLWNKGPHGKVVCEYPDGTKKNEYWEHGKKVKDLNVFESLFKK